MTRKEAIEILSHEKYDSLHSEITEALEMGINSLKLEEMYNLEYEKADEFISKSVIEDIKAYIDMTINLYTLDTEYNKAYKEGLKDALEIIDKHLGKDKENG